MSVTLERPLIEDGKSPLDLLPDDEWGMVRMNAGELRKVGGKVGSSPLEENPYHGEVWGLKGKRSQIADENLYEWVEKVPGIP